MTEMVVIDRVGMWIKYLKARRSDLKGFDHTLSKSITIDLLDVQTFGKTGLSLADDVLDNPNKCTSDVVDALCDSGFIAIFDADDKNISKTTLNSGVAIRFTGVTRVSKLRDIRDEDIGKLISVEGLVKNVTEESMQLKEGYFRCNNCNGVSSKVQPSSSNKVVFPSACQHCEKKGVDVSAGNICLP